VAQDLSPFPTATTRRMYTPYTHSIRTLSRSMSSVTLGGHAHPYGVEAYCSKLKTRGQGCETVAGEYSGNSAPIRNLSNLTALCFTSVCTSDFQAVLRPRTPIWCGGKAKWQYCRQVRHKAWRGVKASSHLPPPPLLLPMHLSVVNYLLGSTSFFSEFILELFIGF